MVNINKSFIIFIINIYDQLCNLRLQKYKFCKYFINNIGLFKVIAFFSFDFQVCLFNIRNEP